MNLTSLKNFAVESRRKLMRIVADKIAFVLAPESAARRSAPETVKALEEAIAKQGRDQVTEATAYMWFNRFCALRFMDANHYTAMGVVTPAEGATRPEILSEAVAGNFDVAITDEQRQRVQALLNGETPSNDRFNDAYRILFIASCNAWAVPMPFMFEKLNDYTELLMPDDLLSANSLLAELREAIPVSDCTDVEIIGWLYQFYISEKKDEVFDGLKANKKISKEDIPAATELFTPHWIVQYLVENSLGRLWMENHPDSRLTDRMSYYIQAEPTGTTPSIASPEDIRICDPCCGSGHMLVYAFDLLYSIYEECGYDALAISGKILSNNLYGLELDPRAAALAAFALTMKARQKHRRFLTARNIVQPHICLLQSVQFTDDEMAQYTKAVGNDFFTIPFVETLPQFADADNLGSLIVPRLQDSTYVRQAIDAKHVADNLFLHATHEKVMKLLEMSDYLSPRYHVVVTNPPYMGSKGMNALLKDFAEKNYPDSKSDLFAMFIERCPQMVVDKGFTAMVTMQSWMFLSSFEKMRLSMLQEETIECMVHMGNMVMHIAFGTSATVWRNCFIPEHKGSYCYVEQNDLYNDIPQIFPPKNERNTKAKDNRFFHPTARDFEKIPGAPVAYWVSGILDAFANAEVIEKHAIARSGLSTGENEKYMRLWYEPSIEKIGFLLQNNEQFLKSSKKYVPCKKGGDFRRWYGDNEYIVDWTNPNQFHRPRTTYMNLYYKPAISWSAITSGKFHCRYYQEGFLFDHAAASLFPEKKELLPFYLAFMSTKVFDAFLSIINPTINTGADVVIKVPLYDISNKQGIQNCSKQCIDLSKSDWDRYETSWDFQCCPLAVTSAERAKQITYDLNSEVSRKKVTLISEHYIHCRQGWEHDTVEMHRLEEENNRIFIEAYGLQDELTPDVPWNEITLTCNPWYRYGMKVDSGQMPVDSEKMPMDEALEARLKTDTVKEFLSYAVGCMFGRYSLDKPGLVLANQGETLADYLKQIPEPSFRPDEDGIIPILDEDWFDDDIVTRFNEFLKVSYGEDSFHENLTFIEEALGKDLRSYFTKDFYKDHLQRYHNRPIYWLFSSPKGAFSALIYMHRYRPETAGIVLTYLRSHITKVTERIHNLDVTIDSADATAGMKTKAIRERTKLQKNLQELEDYERDVLYPLSTEKIAIDLDDGVKVNYQKFGKALRKVSGLDAKEE